MAAYNHGIAPYHDNKTQLYNSRLHFGQPGQAQILWQKFSEYENLGFIEWERTGYEPWIQCKKNLIRLRGPEISAKH